MLESLQQISLSSAASSPSLAASRSPSRPVGYVPPATSSSSASSASSHDQHRLVRAPQGLERGLQLLTAAALVCLYVYAIDWAWWRFF
jgi:hypothetical protein